ncbi:MAG: ABC transporter permease [Butyrivibrio sp.]|nr:ABC transporter permease [Butyrivibrio sp.]
MFLHLFKYRFKSFIRSKEEVFWVALFPIILCTCFVAAFSGINDKEYVFHSIPVAVVYEQENPIFKAVMNNLSGDGSDEKSFLNITETDAEAARKLLSDSKVDAIITVDSSVKMTVAEEGLNQTAVQNFIGQYLQKSALIEDILNNKPDGAAALIASVFGSSDYVTEGSLTDAKMDAMASYYFALIAMALLFGGFFGLRCARQMKANITPEGMRKSIAPQNRGIMIIAEFLATYLIHLIIMAILLLYMVFVLKINLSPQIGYIALTCAVGSLTGVSIGIFIGSLPRLKETVQTTVFIVFSLLSSFLGGLMVWTIRVNIERSAPIINRINPATLIADALYSLLIYNTHERFFRNIITLAVYAVVMCTVSILMTRRNTYANL